MKRIMVATLAVILMGGAALTVYAQDQMTPGPPKVLVIYREMEKYGKHAGHVKNETAFAQAFAASKSPGRFLAVTAMSGPGEVWFLSGFDSFDTFEKTNKFEMQSSVQPQLERLSEQDAEYVSEGTQILAHLNEKSSYRSDIDVSQMRYFEITTIRIRPGHNKDWQELVNLFNTTAAKIKLDETDDFYDVTAGAPDGTILIFTPHKSLAELDTALANNALMTALGDGGQKRWSELVEAAIVSARSELFSFSPNMSYPPDDWVKEDPSYWKPKASAMPKAAPSAKKPAPPTKP